MVIESGTEANTLLQAVDLFENTLHHSILIGQEEMTATDITNLFRSRLRFKVIFFVLTSVLLLLPEIHAGVLAQSSTQTPSPTDISGKNFTDKDTAAYTPRRGLLKKNLYGRVPPDITRGDRNGTRISVTFDGGYNAKEAGEILDILKKRRIKTTIFLTGVFISKYPDITRRIVAEGHEVGNHTMSHPHLTNYEKTFLQTTLPSITKEVLLSELKRTEQLYQKVTGVEMAPLWRAPYGEVNSQIRGWAFSAGYLHVGWTQDYKRKKSLDSLDWVTDKSSQLYLTAGEIKKKILSFYNNSAFMGGGIVLMHLGTERETDRAATVLGEILDGLLEKGLSPVKLSEIIEDKQALKEAQINKDRFFHTRRLAKAPVRSGTFQ